MVSKLYLAAGEVAYAAANSGAEEGICSRLRSHFYEIGEGIGIHKSPELHGAFPTDAYSHTPAHRGAQQPGMTGQVKEDILASFFELGLTVVDGVLRFNPVLLRKSELREKSANVDIILTEKQREKISIPSGSLCFTICQVPVLYTAGAETKTEIEMKNGSIKKFEGLHLDRQSSAAIFQRSGEIKKIVVTLEKGSLIDK